MPGQKLASRLSEEDANARIAKLRQKYDFEFDLQEEERTWSIYVLNYKGSQPEFDQMHMVATGQA